MIRARVIPCLLLKGQGLVKTVRFCDPKYVGDPINTVRIFNEKGADELVFLDITASREKKPVNFELLSRISSEAFMPFAYGGGVRTVQDAQKLFYLGVEKVILNSVLLENPDLISDFSRRFGSQSVVASIDVKQKPDGKYEIFSHAGTVRQNGDPLEFAQRFQGLGAGEILLTSIDRDGTRTGYDLALVEKISKGVQIPVIASGGAGSLEDFRRAMIFGGASGVAAGSFFVFHGKLRAVLITYPSGDEIKNLLA